jgi:hypothetical protein
MQHTTTAKNWNVHICTMHEHKLHIHQAGEIACEPDLNCGVLSFQPVLG